VLSDDISEERKCIAMNWSITR